MRFRLLRLVLACVTVFPVVAGCAARQVVESSGSAQWTGLGVMLTLPAGRWEIEEVERGRVVTFGAPGDAGQAALLRVDAHESDSPGIALMRLFAHFEEKTELARGARTLRSGIVGVFAEYAVEVEGRTIPVLAFVLRRGKWTYDLVAWDMDRATFDAFLEGWAFPTSGNEEAGECRS